MMRNVFVALVFAVSLPVFSQRYSEHIDSALAYVQQDSLALAEQSFIAALRTEPAHPYNAVVFCRLGAVQQMLNRYEDALQSYTLSLNIAPKSVTTLLSRGALYVLMERGEEAYVDYLIALDLEPTNTEALLMAAYLAMQHEDYKTSHLYYNRLLALNPDHRTAIQGLMLLREKEEQRKSLNTFKP